MAGAALTARAVSAQDRPKMFRVGVVPPSRADEVIE